MKVKNPISPWELLFLALVENKFKLEDMIIGLKARIVLRKAERQAEFYEGFFRYLKKRNTSYNPLEIESLLENIWKNNEIIEEPKRLGELVGKIYLAGINNGMRNYRARILA
jgi:hypothetical protein